MLGGGTWEDAGQRVEAFSYKMNMLWRSDVEMLTGVNNTAYT